MLSRAVRMMTGISIAFAAEFLQHRESVASGESEVEHDEVERARAARGQRFVAVGWRPSRYGRRR